MFEKLPYRLARWGSNIGTLYDTWKWEVCTLLARGQAALLAHKQARWHVNHTGTQTFWHAWHVIKQTQNFLHFPEKNSPHISEWLLTRFPAPSLKSKKKSTLQRFLLFYPKNSPYISGWLLYQEVKYKIPFIPKWLLI